MTMGPPTQMTPTKLADYLDVMSKAVFQTGISWKVVASKWPGTRAAFRDFDPEAVSMLTPTEIDELASDTRIIRNRRKIEAIMGNAARMLELESEHGGFQKYLRSKGDDYPAVAKDLRKNFKFMGEMGAYYFLYVVGEKVPSHEEFVASRR